VATSPNQRLLRSTEAPDGGDLSLAVRLDAVCNRFETAWRAGVPRLEEFLAGWQGEERLALDVARRLNARRPAAGDSDSTTFLQVGVPCGVGTGIYPVGGQAAHCRRQGGGRRIGTTEREPLSGDPGHVV
jgi:hypothetical protein